MKFYSIKQEGKWFASVPSSDADSSVQDGRVYRSWELSNGNSGQTLGWFKKSLEGLIVSAEVRSLGDNMVFCINLDNGDVAQFRLYESCFLGLANVLAGINLNDPIRLDAALKTKKPWINKKTNKQVIPTVLYISQGGERLAQVWQYNADERWFDGLPLAIVTEKFGQPVKDTRPTEEAFDEQVNMFIERVNAFSIAPAQNSVVSESTDEDETSF
jgi:hypothetical protein